MENSPHIKKALFAGGCFWCMALPYYDMEGVVKVISGYAGGKEKNPTYEEVKAQRTGHKETVLIYYDERKISYETLLRAYFASIDPFDDEGQFIDRGKSYTTAVFTNDKKEKELFKQIAYEYEKQFGKKVVVSLLEEAVFYPAEEYHQDFHLKNPERMKKELEERNNYKKGVK
jgi:peptide-methionine (S)-S-oxide reductase